MDKTLSWFGNVKDKFDDVRSDINNIINQIPFEYAENQILTAGANVKQFCSEFMEEMLPETMINSCTEKPSPSAIEKLRTGVNGGPTKAPSDDFSPFPMEIIEHENNDSPLETEIKVEKELCFEELRFRETILPIEAYDHKGEHYFHESLPSSPSSIFIAEEGEGSKSVIAEISDVKKEHSAVEILDNSTCGSSENRLSENQGLSLGHYLSTELMGLNDVMKATETEDSHGVKAPNVMENKCMMLDTQNSHLAPDLPETFISQGRVCKSCLTMQFDKECGCKRRTTISADGEAESGISRGESGCQPLHGGESELPDQESDWVIV